MTTGLFDIVKQSVSAIDVARHYGYEPTRAGFIPCPFHMDKSPSLKLYPGTGGWFCFGCGAGGSVVDFVAGVFNMPARDAAEKMIEDFGLSDDNEPRGSYRKVSNVRAEYDAWKTEMINLLNAVHRAGYMALKNKTPETVTEAEALAIQAMPVAEAWAECLSYGDLDEQIKLFRARESIKRTCQQILNALSTKSLEG